MWDLKLVKDLRIIEVKQSWKAAVRSRTFISPQKQMLVNVIIIFLKIIGVHVYAFS